MKTTIGMVTVGQAPRDDIVPQMAARLGPEISIIQEGALNGLSAIEIEALAPEPDQIPLCTRIADGRQVILAKEKILSLIQTKIDTLNRRAVDLILLLCTDPMPHFESRCLVVAAQKIVDKCVEALIDRRCTLGLMVPLLEQKEECYHNFISITPNIHVASASPYGPVELVSEAGESLREPPVDLVVMHCMGYTDHHRQIVRQTTGKPVLAASSMVARTLAELLSG